MENKTGEALPFKIAEAVPVDIDVVQEAVWVENSAYAYGKFSIVAAGAKSISVNFDQFKLPKGTELYVYSENGEMITGPVMDNENNENNFWGSWVYKGGMLTVDFKTPTESRTELKLHISSVAYGYKDIYQSKVSNFGASGSCNVNVLCAAGNGWENERNSVAIILNGSSTALCTGALINNSSNLNIPYLLTANHCFEADPNATNWKFTFQAWSATCTPSQNATGTTFNGSTLRARNAASDFCLVELNTPPTVNSCITAAGWSRSSTAATNATSMHHPSGDVMKISVDNNQVTRASYSGTSNNHWKVTWDLGVTEGGSSGSPLFDQNHRIVGQLHGGPSGCSAADLSDFYGSFDRSWTGGGTNSTRLSNWLDPGNNGVMTTNARLAGLTITGPSVLCTTNRIFTLQNAPVGANVNWSVSPASLFAVDTGSGASFTTRAANASSSGSGFITAQIFGECGNVSKTYNVWVGKPQVSGILSTGGPLVEGSVMSVCNLTTVRALMIITGSAGVSWTKFYSNPGNITWSQEGNNLKFNFYMVGQTAEFRLTVSNDCGSILKEYQFKSIDCSSNCNQYQVSPNPASKSIDIVVPNIIPPCATTTLTSEDFAQPEIQNELSIQSVILVDLQGQALQAQDFSGNAKKASLDISKLKKGVYILKVSGGMYFENHRIVIE